MIKLIDIRKNGNHRYVFFCGVKLYSYKKRHRVNFHEGITDFSLFPACSNIKTAEAEYLSLIIPVYFQSDNFEKLNKLIAKYDTEYSPELKEKVRFIIVDDGSEFPVSLPECNLNISLLRVDKDIPWNNSGARNLGACYASTSRLFMCDVDWFVPQDTMEFSLRAYLSDKDVLLFNHSNDKEMIRVHPNIYALNKATYMSFNGYDEYYCGFYGEDIPFRKRLFNLGINFIRSDKFISLNSVMSEHSLSRDLGKLEDAMLKAKSVIDIIKPMLCFPWHIVEVKSLKR